MDFKNKSYPIFTMFDEAWGLLAAGSEKDFNMMTISWGMMGTLWGLPFRGKPVVTVFVNPARYTNQFMEKEEYFTVNFLPKEYKKQLTILGSRSGREIDKKGQSGLTPVFEGKGITFKESELSFICKKIYSKQFDGKQIPPDVYEFFYEKHQAEPHIAYIGDVVDAISQEDGK